MKVVYGVKKVGNYLHPAYCHDEEQGAEIISRVQYEKTSVD